MSLEMVCESLMRACFEQQNSVNVRVSRYRVLARAHTWIRKGGMYVYNVTPR